MEGVHANNPQYKLFPSANDVAVKRYKEPISEGSLNKICDYARSEICKRYSVPSTFGSVIWFVSGELKTVDRQFCSRLVAMSYAAAGINLVRNPLRCTPNRVFRSADLVAVPDACREASQAELALAARHGTSIVTKQEEITNKLLADIRAATNSQVETISDMVELVISKPETDAKVLSILNDSGYLFMWMEMRQRFPEWYDAEVYAQSVPAELQREIADALHKSILDSLRRHRHNNAILLEAFSHHQRKTIAVLQQLEITLYELDQERLAVVEQFRSNVGAK
jgi:hypothetical protein